MSAHRPMPRSAWLFPALAVLLFAVATALGLTFTPSAGGLLFAAVLLSILFGTVFAAVHHAEVIAERIGEPYGTLLLTLAVTIIEVALIATIMLGDKPVPALAHEPKQFVRFPDGGHENLQSFGAIAAARHFINAASS